MLGACVEKATPTHRARHLWGKEIHPEHDYAAACPVPDVAAYFNSGVLAIDLDAWREADVESRIVDYASRLPSAYVLPDQDTLNILLWEEWFLLDWKRWNWPGYVMDRLAWETHGVHFTGPTKPWIGDPLGVPFSREYRRAAKNVGWRPRPPALPNQVRSLRGRGPICDSAETIENRQAVT